MKVWLWFAICAFVAAQIEYDLHQAGLVRRQPMKKFVKSMTERVGYKISKNSNPALQHSEGPDLPLGESGNQASLNTIPKIPQDVRGSVTIHAGQRDKGDRNTYGFVRYGKTQKSTEYIGSRANQLMAKDFSHPDKLSVAVEPKQGDSVRSAARAEQVTVKMEIPKGGIGYVDHRHSRTEPFKTEEVSYKDSPVRRVFRGRDGETVSGVGRLEISGKKPGRLRTTGQNNEPSIV